MSSRAFSSRRVLALLAGLTALAAVPACGADLGKANFPRTTLTASAGADQAPTGEITDEAVALPALRAIDPCRLVDKDSLADFGTPEDTNSYDFDQCSNKVQDAGGKSIRFALTLGDTIIAADSKVNGVVEGLPQIEEKQDDKTCSVSALTSRTPSIGITLRVDYEGGDACGSGTTLLRKMIKRLHEDPPKYDLSTGSLIPVDPCASIDEAAIGKVVKDEKPSASSLHACNWNARSVTARLSFRRGVLPDAGSGYTKVDLGGGISGVQKLRADPSQCTINWQHQAIDEQKGENVSVDYTNYAGKAPKDDPCGKTLKLVKNVLSHLPKP